MSGPSKRLFSIVRQTTTKSLLENVGVPTANSFAFTPSRFHGGGVPEYFGKPSPYTEGTDFLGTPKDHLKLVEKRPVAPHVFDVGGKGMHYKFPFGAISSVTNRVTGVVLSGGVGALGLCALTGDAGAMVDSFKTAYPLLVFPTKFGIGFSLVYHYLGGLRHLWWDAATHGNQATEISPLEPAKVEQQSKILLGAGTVGGFIVALM